MRTIIPGFLLIAAATATAMDESRVRQFLADQEQQYRHEYQRCTGDSSNVSLDVILQWREETRPLTASVDSRKLVREFSAATGANPDSVLPCEAWAWKNKPSVVAQNDSTSRTTPDTSSPVVLPPRVDSPTEWTIDSIRMGMSRDTLLYELPRRGMVVAVPDKWRLLVERFPWGGGRFYPTTFALTGSGRVYGYSIELPLRAADSLDDSVRSDVNVLDMELRLHRGTPTGGYRAGIFDVKEGRLTPLQVWHDAGMTAYAGIIRRKGRFAAAAMVYDPGLARSLRRLWIAVEKFE